MQQNQPDRTSSFSTPPSTHSTLPPLIPSRRARLITAVLVSLSIMMLLALTLMAVLMSADHDF